MSDALNNSNNDIEMVDSDNRKRGRATANLDCPICDESGRELLNLDCGHVICLECFYSYTSTIILMWIGNVPADVRIYCPCSSGSGKKCTFSLSTDYVHSIISRSQRMDVKKAFHRLDTIIRDKCINQNFPEYKHCPKCPNGYGTIECMDKWCRCLMNDCKHEFCRDCGKNFF